MMRGQMHPPQQRPVRSPEKRPGGPPPMSPNKRLKSPAMGGPGNMQGRGPPPHGKPKPTPPQQQQQHHHHHHQQK